LSFTVDVPRGRRVVVARCGEVCRCEHVGVVCAGDDDYEWAPRAASDDVGLRRRRLRRLRRLSAEGFVAAAAAVRVGQVRWFRVGWRSGFERGRVVRRGRRLLFGVERFVGRVVWVVWCWWFEIRGAWFGWGSVGVESDFSLGVAGPAPLGVPNFFIDSFRIPRFVADLSGGGD